jgi:chromosome partitioning protein
MRTIAVINAKGGSGKTTVATGLASALAWEGHSVGLADLDPQCSSSDWLAEREEDYPEITPVDTQRGLRAPAGVDIMVVDTPAGVYGQDLSKILNKAQTAVMPILPSPVDMAAAWRFLEQTLALKPIQSKRTKLGLIANRVKPHTIVYRELTGFLDDYRVPVVGQLRDSMNYVRAYERGLGVTDLPEYLAGEDWAQWDEIVRWVRSKRSQGSA